MPENTSSAYFAQPDEAHQSRPQVDASTIEFVTTELTPDPDFVELERQEAVKPKGRHKFTRAECQLGFQRAIESIITRYPAAVNKSGMHMACFFLKKKGARA